MDFMKALHYFAAPTLTTGMGRLENKIFLLIIASTRHSMSFSGAPSPIPYSGSPRSSDRSVLVGDLGLERCITASGFGRSTNFPSNRWCPISNVALDYGACGHKADVTVLEETHR